MLSDAIPLGLGALTVLFLLLVIAAVLVGSVVSEQSIQTVSRFGPIGDYVGGFLNPFIALCALLGLLRSIALQRETLRATREDLARQLDQQNFFELLSAREAAVESIQWKTQTIPPETLKGRPAIKEILRLLDQYVGNVDLAAMADDLKIWGVPDSLNVAAKKRVGLFAVLYSGKAYSVAGAWHQFVIEDEQRLENLEEYLGHLFRATYQILKFVYNCPTFSIEKKRDLVNYVRAQMSQVEFIAFALTAATTMGIKSRAIAIATDLYERRLRSSIWAHDLKQLFDAQIPANVELAGSYGYSPLGS